MPRRTTTKKRKKSSSNTTESFFSLKLCAYVGLCVSLRVNRESFFSFSSFSLLSLMRVYLLIRRQHKHAHLLTHSLYLRAYVSVNALIVCDLVSLSSTCYRSLSLNRSHSHEKAYSQYKIADILVVAQQRTYTIIRTDENGFLSSTGESQKKDGRDKWIHTKKIFSFWVFQRWINFIIFPIFFFFY